jgi:hypothetical protein
VHAYGVRLDSPSDERDHARCRRVEPVSVVDDEEQRSIVGNHREEVERGHRGPVMLGRLPARP